MVLLYCRFTCNIDILFYPFDTQSCSLSYYVTDQTEESVMLQVAPVSTEEFSQNSEWSLQNITAAMQTQRSTNIAKITFHVKRRHQFPTFTLIIPLLGQSILIVFCFLVPVESKEKVAMSVMFFFACAIFVTMTRDVLPHHCTRISYYVIYLCGVLLLSLVNMVHAIQETKIYITKGNEKCQLLKKRRFRNRKRVGMQQIKEGDTRVNLNKYEYPTWAECQRNLSVTFFVVSLFGLVLFCVFIFSDFQHKEIA